MSKLYVAYGSNLNLMQMGGRCPQAKPYKTGFIKDYQLIFKGVATIEPEPSSLVPCAVWKIDEIDEKALDIYEGYPNLYRKEDVTVQLDDGEEIQAMAYIMNKGRRYQMPYAYYLEIIAEGYESCGLNIEFLKEALEKTRDKLTNI